jgi:hypothetical protein
MGFICKDEMVSPERRFEVHYSGSTGLDVATNEPGRLLLADSDNNVSTIF